MSSYNTVSNNNNSLKSTYFSAKWKSIFYHAQSKNCPVTEYWYKSEFRQGKMKEIGRQAFFFFSQAKWMIHKAQNYHCNINSSGVFLLIYVFFWQYVRHLYTLKSLICIVLHFHFPFPSADHLVWHHPPGKKKYSKLAWKKGTHNLWSSTRDNPEELKKNKQMI